MVCLSCATLHALTTATPSTVAVDELMEACADLGLRVVRIGDPVRVRQVWWLKRGLVAAPFTGTMWRCIA